MTPYLEWSYKPPAFFEEPFEVEIHGYRLKLADGVATAAPLSPDRTLDDDARRLLTAAVQNALRGAQVRSQASFELSGPSLHHEGGITAFASGIAVGTSVCRADIRALDADGNVVFDSRRARTEETHELAFLAAKHAAGDPTAGKVLRSFEAAVRDPANELVHLYEIRDALKARFRDSKGSREQTGVTKRDWDRLGFLANTAPIEQGRHRGEHPDGLRGATQDELEEARAIARGMVLGYLRWLDSSDR